MEPSTNLASFRRILLVFLWPVFTATYLDLACLHSPHPPTSFLQHLSLQKPTLWASRRLVFTEWSHGNLPIICSTIIYSTLFSSVAGIFFYCEHNNVCVCVCKREGEKERRRLSLIELELWKYPHTRVFLSPILSINFLLISNFLLEPLLLYLKLLNINHHYLHLRF